MHVLKSVLFIATIALASSTVAVAQTTTDTTPATSTAPAPSEPVCGYWDATGHWVDSGQCETSTYCGSTVNGTWVANGNCPDEHGFMRRAYVSGTITSVKGHLVTLAQSRGNLTIDDTAALNAQMTGKVAVGRRIVAIGYWKDGTFYATELQGS